VTALISDYDHVLVEVDHSGKTDTSLPGVPIGIPPWRYIVPGTGPYVAAGFSPASWSAAAERPPSSFPPEERRDQAPALQGGLRPQDADPVSLLQGALRLSAHVLARDKSQLTSQLVGRLGAYPAREIQALLDEGQRSPAGPCLKLSTPSLTRPGGPLVRTLEGHSGEVNAVAVAPEGGQAISASDDQTLKVWDVKTGQAVRTLEGHSDAVRAVAVTPKGGQAISASDDRTLKVWDLASGRCLATFIADAPLRACAMAKDGVTVVAGDQSGTVHLLTLEMADAS